MEYKSIGLVSLFSGLSGAGSVLGAAALTFGPWAAEGSDRTACALLMISGLAFGMLGKLASNVESVLATQADQIADLRRQLGEQTS